MTNDIFFIKSNIQWTIYSNKENLKLFLPKDFFGSMPFEGGDGEHQEPPLGAK
jgi:hypothetical protein